MAAVKPLPTAADLKAGKKDRPVRNNVFAEGEYEDLKEALCQLNKDMDKSDTLHRIANQILVSDLAAHKISELMYELCYNATYGPRGQSEWPVCAKSALIIFYLVDSIVRHSKSEDMPAKRVHGVEKAIRNRILGITQMAVKGTKA